MINLSSLNKHILKLCILLCSCFSFDANAWDYQGYVSNVTIYSGKVYVVVGGGAGVGSNPCSSIVYIIDPGTAGGKALLATALTAKTTGRLVYVWGDNTCSWAPYGSAATGQVMVGLDLKG